MRGKEGYTLVPVGGMAFRVELLLAVVNAGKLEVTVRWPYIRASADAMRATRSERCEACE